METVESKMREIMAQGEAMDAVDEAREDWRAGRRGRKSEAGRARIAKENEIAMERYAKGESIKSIAESFGIGACGLRRRLNSNGYDLSATTKEGMSQRSKEIAQDIFAEYKRTGHKISEIAKRRNLNYSNVTLWLRNHTNYTAYKKAKK
jgi:transposase-like protein